MTKNVRTISLAVTGAIVLIVIVVIGRDVFLRQSRNLDCGDGPRRTIDIRDFTTQYSRYSIELEASVSEKAKISTKLNPVQLQQLSEAMQSARDFRQYVVAGYNTCAVTKDQFVQYGARFQTLDNLAREINDLAGKSSLTQEQSSKLAGLIVQYGELARG
jgi:hypothetical protein